METYVSQSMLFNFVKNEFGDFNIREAYNGNNLFGILDMKNLEVIIISDKPLTIAQLNDLNQGVKNMLEISGVSNKYIY